MDGAAGGFSNAHGEADLAELVTESNKKICAVGRRNQRLEAPLESERNGQVRSNALVSMKRGLISSAIQSHDSIASCQYSALDFIYQLRAPPCPAMHDTMPQFSARANDACTSTSVLSLFISVKSTFSVPL
jgi:hypothetical protein